MDIDLLGRTVGDPVVVQPSPTDSSMTLCEIGRYRRPGRLTVDRVR